MDKITSNNFNITYTEINDNSGREEQKIKTFENMKKDEIEQRMKLKNYL